MDGPGRSGTRHRARLPRSAPAAGSGFQPAGTCPHRGMWAKPMLVPTPRVTGFLDQLPISASMQPKSAVDPSRRSAWQDRAMHAWQTHGRDTGLLTDRYELTMLGAALRGATAQRRCSFEVFARRLPE